jgi:Flp pilus assembly protein TadG
MKTFKTDSNAHAMDPVQTATSTILLRLRRALGTNTDGGALVETAVSLPCILLLMTGIFSFSFALHQKLSLAEAVGVGGRVLAVERGDTDPCKTTTAAIYSAAPTLSQSNLTISYVLNGVPVGSGVTTCPGTSNLVTGGSAQIIASYPTTIGVFGTNWGSFNLGTQITEVVQ